MKLESKPFTVEHPDGKEYAVEDPMALSLDCMGESVDWPTARDKMKAAFGFPTLTIPQAIEIAGGIKLWMEELQKKTFPPPKSPQPTASSPNVRKLD